MAISKTQPMRPAEIELVDTVNTQGVTLSGNTLAIENLDSDLAAEVLARENEDSLLDGKITTEATNRTNADAAINAKIGVGFDSEHTIAGSLSATNQNVTQLGSDIETMGDHLSDMNASIADLQTFDSHIKFGHVLNLTIPANDSISYDASFVEAFESDATVIVLAQVVTSELLTLFDYTLTACDYSGFSFTLSNSDSTAHTVSLEYVAFRTSADPLS